MCELMHRREKKGKLNVVAVGKWIQSLDFFIGWMAGRWCWGFGCSCSIRQFLQVRPFLELAACQAGCHIEIELYVLQCVCWSMILPVQCTTRAVSLSQTSRLQIQLDLDSTGHAWIYQESLLALVGCDFFILQSFDATCRYQYASNLLLIAGSSILCGWCLVSSPWARRGDKVKHLSVFGRQFEQAPGEEISFEEQVP